MATLESNRPYSTPPTNVEGSNDYVGVDRGLFLSRDPSPKYLRVVQADWKTYGPSNAPGILRFKLGQYPERPVTDEQFEQYTILKAHGGDEWFDVSTSGPINSAILVEYWAKFIYYNYYILTPPDKLQSVMDDEPLVADIKGIGKAFTKSLVPSIDEIVVQAMYGTTLGTPLSLLALSAEATPVVGDSKVINLKALVDNPKGFDPVIAVSKLM